MGEFGFTALSRQRFKFAQWNGNTLLNERGWEPTSRGVALEGRLLLRSA